MNMRIERKSAAERSRLSVYFKFRFAIVLGALTALVALISVSLIQSNQHEVEHNKIVNALGKQRMRSQQIAKEANRIASLLEAIDSDERVQDVATLRAKLADVRASMVRTADDFDVVFSQIERGYLLLPETAKNDSDALFKLTDPTFIVTTGEMRDLWRVFYRQVSVIASSESKSANFRNALVYINEQNERLLSLSDELSNSAIENFSRVTNREQIGLSVMGLALLALIAWIIYGTYRFVVEPYTMFYRGIKTLGDPSSLNATPARKKYSPITEEVYNTFSILRDMVNLVDVINRGSSFPETLALIFRTFKVYIPYDYIGIATFAGYRGTKLLASYGESNGAFPSLPLKLGTWTWDIELTSLGPILSSGEPRIINDLAAYAETRPPREYTQILLEAGIRSSITLPLVLNGVSLGFLFFSSKRTEVYTDMHARFLQNIRNTIALAFEKNIFADELVYASTLALAKMAEARDEDTADHLERMAQYAVLLTKCMHADGLHNDAITLEFIKEIKRFSPMHDIGKVGIRDNVLLKPAKLDEEEWAHMRTHTTYGATVLQEAENSVSLGGRSLFGMGILIAGSHHEKWDGSGYPQGLKGEEIPLAARIVAVADVFDALTTKRPYKEAYGFDESIEIMRQGKGSHFDPEIFECFERNATSFKALYEKFFGEKGFR